MIFKYLINRKLKSEQEILLNDLEELYETFRILRDNLSVQSDDELVHLEFEDIIEIDSYIEQVVMDLNSSNTIRKYKHEIYMKIYDLVKHHPSRNMLLLTSHISMKHVVSYINDIIFNIGILRHNIRKE